MYTFSYLPGADERQDGRLLPWRLLRRMEQAAGADSAQAGRDTAFMHARGLLWAVIRTRLDVLSPVGDGPVTLTTSDRGWQGVTAVREYRFTQTGRILAEGVSLWVLIDEKTHGIVRPPKDMRFPYAPGERTAALTPARLTPAEGETLGIVTARSEDIDTNGHVNNARYLEWITRSVTLPPAQWRLEINYYHEVLPGQKVRLTRAGDIVCGTLETGETAFAAQIESIGG